MSKITMDGEYRTEQGYPVRIIAIDRKNEYCVIGLVTESPGQENIQSWKIDGTREFPGSDLVPVPTKHDGFIIISSDLHPGVLKPVIYESRQEAEAGRSAAYYPEIWKVIPITWED
jgi:hypothetical protein